MLQSEKQFNTKSTFDAFDEIYTNYDISVNETYLADTGYPFDYPTRWLNDPSMNKRIAIRRLDVTPSTHSFTITISAHVNETYENVDGEYYTNTATIDVTQYDNLIKVLNFICSTFSYDIETKKGGLQFEYSNKTNKLILCFTNSAGESVPFTISNDESHDPMGLELDDFLKFLNQPLTSEIKKICEDESELKEFNEVWNRDRIHFHASFSTSRRRFIGKKGDFYQTLSLLYPAPTNESTFYVRFTSNGIKNILIRHCEFDIQLCYIVNFKKSSIL